MSKKTKAIVVRDEPKLTTFKAEALISQAIKQGASVETMERLLAMRKELKADFAKEAYNDAMAQFQSECPTIKKTREVKTKAGIVAYRYAPLDEIVKQVKSLIQRHGFSYAIQTELKESGVRSICIVKHREGHSEEYAMEVPLGNKTDIMSQSQVVAAAATFSKRYAFCNAFGILTGDDDVDGNVNTNARGNSTPKDTAPKNGSDMTRAEAYQKAKRMIAGQNDKATLKQWRTGIMASKSYSPTEKETLVKLIDEKIK